MKIEEAIVYVLACSGHGMKTEQIAREINERGLIHRWGKALVDSKMVYAVVMSHPDKFDNLEMMRISGYSKFHKIGISLPVKE